MVRVLIVDDHDIVRKGVRDILTTSGKVEVCGEAMGGVEALKMAAQMAPDIILLDLSLPDMSGMDVLKRLKGSTRVIVLSMHSERPYVTRALQAGAYGYVSKQTASRELMEAILKVADGGKYLSQSLYDEVSIRSRQTDTAPHEGLSGREFEVMMLLSSGVRPTDIAGRLDISVKTVSTYRTRILDKLSLDSNADITMYCLRHQLISND